MGEKSTSQTVHSGKSLIPGCNPNDLALSVAGNIVKHLGVQMYAGRPVPAIAELISNGWDADAKTVEVSIPLDEPWDSTNQKQTIVVSDDGNGMNWEMVRRAYLNVGRDRRVSDNTDKSPGGRKIQGRKGVGKLAGFGIADTLEVQTVHNTKHPGLNSKALIWFKLDLSDLTKVQEGPASVDLIYAGPTNRAPDGARKKSGTTIILRDLHDRKSQNSERFTTSMARRFLFSGAGFLVKVNGQPLSEDKIQVQWREPESGWASEEVTGCGPVKYWIGFTEQPRKQNQGDLSGILIYTRGKISQEETFFDISGGVTGQHGLRYLVGMIRAEWLDAGVQSTDFIATPRDSIAWESPQGAAFKDWGQSLVRRALSDWAKFRSSLREKHVTSVNPEMRARIEGLSPTYKDAALQFVEKFKSVEMEPDEFEEILSWFLGALENATLRNILRRLKETDTDDLEELDDLLSKMEVRTAVTLLQVIDSNLAAIDTLERMHRDNAKERGVISKHIEKNPWLIHPTWMLNKAEARVATWIKDEFNLVAKNKGSGDDDRADYFCVAVGGTLHIVEIKRGGYIAKLKDMNQADKYRKYILKRFQELTDPEAIKYAHVQSHLIAASLHEDAESIKESFADKGWVMFSTWDDLIERAKRSHIQFRQILEKRSNETGDSPKVSGSDSQLTIKPKKTTKKR